MKLIKSISVGLAAFALIISGAILGTNFALACEPTSQTQPQFTVATIQPVNPVVPVGTSAVVKGTGWIPGEAVTISVEAGSTREYFADAKGNVQGRVVIPSNGEQNRTYQIFATNNKFGFDSKVAFSSIITAKTVVSLVDPSSFTTLTTSSQYIENHFTAGQSVLFQGSGYLPFETIETSIEGIWGTDASVTADSNGNFNLLYTFPSDINYDHLRDVGQGVLRQVFRAKQSGAFRKITGLVVRNS